MKNLFETLMVLLAGIFTSASAFGAEEIVTETTNAGMGNAAFIGLAAGLGIAFAAFGGATAQGRICAAAMEGIARNPNAQKSMFTSMILGLALIESLILLTFAVSFLLYGKL